MSNPLFFFLVYGILNGSKTICLPFFFVCRCIWNDRRLERRHQSNNVRSGLTQKYDAFKRKFCSARFALLNNVRFSPVFSPF